MARSLSKKKRFEIFARDSYTCRYCGASPPDVKLHVDHMTPYMAMEKPSMSVSRILRYVNGIARNVREQEELEE